MAFGIMRSMTLCNLFKPTDLEMELSMLAARLLPVAGHGICGHGDEMFML
jgi:hypothetical protein